MAILISEDTSKVIKNKNKLERFLNVKITIKANEISIEGNPEDEYIAEQVLDSISLGFPVSIALLIKEDSFLFERIDIKQYTKRKDLEVIRARIIGKDGKTLKTLATLTDCYFEIKNNSIGIIGSAENIENAHTAIISLIQGSKQANVYAFLEKHRAEPILDLGLKKKEKNKAK